MSDDTLDATWCLWCGDELPDDSHSTMRRYCAQSCKQAYRNALRMDIRHGAAPLRKTCPGCMRTFEAFPEWQTYCSRDCYNSRRPKPVIGALPPVERCAGCGATFKPGRGLKKYCGRPCYDARGRRHLAPHLAPNARRQANISGDERRTEHPGNAWKSRLRGTSGNSG